MRMLYWLCSKTGQYKIRNDIINRVDVTPIIKMMVET